MRRRSRRALDELEAAGSLAEFRRDAHTVRASHLTGVVVLDAYFTFAALGVSIAFLAMGLYGGVTAPAGASAKTGSMWLALIAFVVGTLVVARLVRLVSNARKVRKAVETLSRETEERAAAGQLPAEPADWQGPMPPALVANGRAWL